MTPSVRAPKEQDARRIKKVIKFGFRLAAAKVVTQFRVRCHKNRYKLTSIRPPDARLRRRVVVTPFAAKQVI